LNWLDPKVVSMDDPIQYWNEQAGPKWVMLQEQLDKLMDPLGRHLMDWSEVGPGERVLDVGCGCGSTSLELAERVGPSGQVVGLDVSAPMLEHAKRRSQSQAVRPDWRLADAASHSFEEPFDLIYSRFGVMFFGQPEAAFAHLAKQLKPSGRMCFLCWRPLALNPFFQAGLQAAQPFVELPPPSSTELPGPFSLSPPGKVEKLLHQCGYSQIEVSPWDSHIHLGGIRETAQFLLQMGPVAPLVQDAGPQLVDKIRHQLEQILGDFERNSQGHVLLPTATWQVRAKI
jgi:SAM-dependent methyltransferase